MKLTLALLLCLIWVATTQAQEHPAVTAQPNSVFVSADGKYEAAPDTAVLQFNVSAQEDKAKAAFDHASREVDQVRQVMRANDIDPKAATIGRLSVQPVYDWKDPKHKVIGYKVSTDITLKLKDFSKIGPLTEQLADANVSESQSLTYTLDNMDDAKSKAVEDAYRHARASADTLARASGRTLGDLSYASVDTFENMRIVAPMMRNFGALAMKAEAAPAPTEQFTPQTVNVTAHVNALFSLK